MEQLGIISTILGMKQDDLHTKIGMEIMKDAARADQSLADMLMKSINEGKVVTNRAVSGRVDLYA